MKKIIVMKKIKSLSAILILVTTISFGFLSCDNEPIDPAIDLNLPPNGSGNSTGIFTAKTGTTNFIANELIEADYTSTQIGTQLSIIALTTDGKSMIIQILNPVIGTRTATNDINNLISFSYAASVNDLYASINTANGQYNGTINITQFNTTTNKISGTFNFTGYGALSNTAQIEVTQGVFTNISFTNSVTATPPTSGIAGTYLLTAFNTSVSTDLNGDGISSSNQLNETVCFNNSILKLNANNTFTSDAKGLDIDITGTTSVLTCFEDPDFTGTWSLAGNQLSLTYMDSGQTQTDVFTVAGNNLSLTVQNGEIVGTAAGSPVYLTSNITIVYTKQ
ncbi:MAG: hypothetical protein ACI9XR_001138 [Flavobacterium sp.]|jgi:hypothetical protein